MTWHQSDFNVAIVTWSLVRDAWKVVYLHVEDGRMSTNLDWCQRQVSLCHLGFAGRERESSSLLCGLCPLAVPGCSCVMFHYQISPDWDILSGPCPCSLVSWKWWMSVICLACLPTFSDETQSNTHQMFTMMLNSLKTYLGLFVLLWK